MLLLVMPIAAAVFTGAQVERLQAVVGVLLVGLGAGLRLASARVIGRGARVHRADLRGELATAGPYRWSRNPLYVAAGLIIAGLGLHAGCGWPALILLPATLFVYTPIVWHEESALTAAGGESYLRYRGRVWRWIGPPAPPDGGFAEIARRAPWSEVLRRERFLIPGMICAVAGLTLVRTGRIPLGDSLEGLAPGTRAEVLGPILVGLGMVGNSMAIVLKRRRPRHS